MVTSPRHFFILLVALVILGLAITAQTLIPVISHITIEDGSTAGPVPVTFPHEGYSTKEATYRFQLEYAKGQAGRFLIIPGSCVNTIRVNGTEIPITAPQLKMDACSSVREFRMDFTPYLH